MIFCLTIPRIPVFKLAEPEPQKCEAKKEEADEKIKKAKKERRSSIFANFSKRLKDNDHTKEKTKKSDAGSSKK